jgi:hypothetical protein
MVMPMSPLMLHLILGPWRLILRLSMLSVVYQMSALLAQVSTISLIGVITPQPLHGNQQLIWQVPLHYRAGAHAQAHQASLSRFAGIPVVLMPSLTFLTSPVHD